MKLIKIHYLGKVFHFEFSIVLFAILFPNTFFENFFFFYSVKEDKELYIER